MFQPIIAVDFDGTITKEHNFQNFSQNDEINPHAVEVLNRLHEKGCRIILWTCREGQTLEEAKIYCNNHSIPIDYYNENVPELHFTARKVFANYYIDDLHFTKNVNFLELEKAVMKDNYFKI